MEKDLLLGTLLEFKHGEAGLLLAQRFASVGPEVLAKAEQAVRAGAYLAEIEALLPS